MFKVEFSTGNAAFADDPDGEPARILREIAKKLADGARDGNIRDANGNTIGWWLYRREDEDE